MDVAGAGMSIRERHDPDVFEMGFAQGIVALQGDGAVLDEAAFHSLGGHGGCGFGPIRRDFAVDFEGDMLAFDDDVVDEPLVVFGGRDIHHVLDVIEAAGFFAVALGLVDLRFKAL